MLHFSPSFPKTNSRIRIETQESEAIILPNAEMSNAFVLSARPNWRGSKHRIVLRRRARRVYMDDVLRRIEIEMSDPRSWLSLGSLRIGIDDKVGIRRLDRIAVTFQVRCLADKPSIQK